MAKKSDTIQRLNPELTDAARDDMEAALDALDTLEDWIGRAPDNYARKSVIRKLGFIRQMLGRVWSR